jgi:hypothetical protein
VSTKVKSLVGAAAAVLMLGSAALLATATGASAKTGPVKTIIPFAGEFHPISNAGHSGECLQPLTPDFRAPIVQRPCDGSAAQEWATLSTPSGGTHYRFLNTSGWCMSVDRIGNGAPVLQDECEVSGGTTVSNAEWNSSATLPNVVTLQSRFGFVNRTLCLDEPGASGGNVNMQLFNCNGTLAQIWVVGFGN